MGRPLIVLRLAPVATIKVLLMVGMSSHGNEAPLVLQLLGSNEAGVKIAGTTTTLVILLRAEALHLGHVIAIVALIIMGQILTMVPLKILSMVLPRLEALLPGNNLLLLAVKAMAPMQAT
jgi:hypothetical protein